MSLVKPGQRLTPRVCSSGNGVVRPGRLTCNTGRCSPWSPKSLRDNTNAAPTVPGQAGSQARYTGLSHHNQWFLGQHPAHTHSECCVGSDTETATIVTSAISQSSIQFIILVTVFVEVIFLNKE